MYIVKIGQEEKYSKEDENETRHQHLLLFLYTIYSNFSLAKNLIETFVGPRDERNILQLALSQMKFNDDVCFPIQLIIWFIAKFGPFGCHVDSNKQTKIIWN